VGARLRSFADGEGYRLTQGHLSFVGGLLSPEVNDLQKRQLELFSAIGIENAVLHFNGGKELTPEERFDRRVECVRQLQGCVAGSGLYLCLENLGSVPFTHRAENILQLIDDCGGKNLGICLDTGHLHLTRIRDGNTQTTTEFVRTAGDRLKALHIHENNGMADDHQMPFSAKKAYDWRELIRALDEVGYQGLFDMEIVGESIRHPLAVRDEKLKYVRFLCEYMLSDEFLNEE
jgi:sugar phosphate isomerase/epimerase